MSYNLEECSFEREPAQYQGIFRFIGEKPFDICNVNKFKLGDVITSAGQFVSKPQRERQL